ncbi:MAG: tetratricopeptide repeat protein [Chitinophagaceae bacterium]|jgi:tetratricopeptide (TPR) repeat protein|nr:tetratricopeptide repeat protein [Chitinophagaceae bacterium]
MKQNPFRQDREEIKELLRLFENLKNGRSHSFLEEEAFEKLIDYFDEKEDMAQAMQAAELGVEIYPYSSALLLKKADLLLAARQYKQALEILEQAELLDSNDINLFILKTDAYLALDQQSKAVEVLQEGLELFTGEERIELLFELADVYDDYEEFEKVFDCLKLVLEEEPTNEEALYKICFWTDFTGRNEESIRLHLNIINDYPYSELAWFNLGAAYQGLKLYEKSIDAYMYCIAIDEKFDYAYRNIGDAYIRLRKYKEAIEMLEKVLELSRPEEVIHEAIGYCYDRMAQYAQARFHYRKASHMNPDDSKLFYKIACTYMNEGQYESAIKQLQQALKIHRLQPDYNLAMGMAFAELERYKEAVEYFAHVIKQRPKSVKGWSAMLECMLKSNMLDNADEYACAAYEATGGKPIFIFYRAAVFFATGKTKQAIHQLETAMATAPKMIKKLIELQPKILQHPQVVDLIARYKRSRSI